MMPILVTGGAGYIGSHAMLALKDAGWSVSVIDDLSNGARSAVPGDVPFYEGDIADGALVDAHLRRAGHRGDHAFRGIDRGAGVGRASARLLPQQHGRQPCADRRRGSRRIEAHPLLLDRGRLWRSGAGADLRGRSEGSDQPVWRIEADDRADAERRVGRPPVQLWRASLFQRRRRRSEGPRRAAGQGLDAPDQGRGRSRGRQARPCRGLWHRLPDSGRHLHPRLHPRQRPCRGACRRARMAD